MPQTNIPTSVIAKAITSKVKAFLSANSSAMAQDTDSSVDAGAKALADAISVAAVLAVKEFMSSPVLQVQMLLSLTPVVGVTPGAPVGTVMAPLICTGLSNTAAAVCVET